MVRKYCKYRLVILIICLVTSLVINAQQQNNPVKIVGQMKDVMWQGQLSGNIDLDTITDKTNLYGLGPVEYLSGEILILNGKSYKSTVTSDSTMLVEETYQVKAPFFGYTNIPKWTEQLLPDNIQTIHQLERYLDTQTKNANRPFMFKLSGMVEKATIHIVNLPKGAKVRTPEDAHQGQKNYTLNNKQTDIVGFFSTTHQAIFTHHDTFLHMHLISADRKFMGHLDGVLIKAGTMKLYLPEQ